MTLCYTVSTSKASPETTAGDRCIVVFFILLLNHAFVLTAFDIQEVYLLWIMPHDVFLTFVLYQASCFGIGLFSNTIHRRWYSFLLRVIFVLGTDFQCGG